jgi:hypothetical protein
MIPLILTVIWFAFFTPEISLTLLWIFDPGLLVQREVDSIHLREAIGFTILALVTYPLFLVISLWMASQFLLPVKLPSERLKVFKRLFLFLTGGHGPAVFIKEGEIKGSLEELQSSRPGVAFVDLTSAIVLERQPYVSAVGGSVSPSERRRRARAQPGNLAQSVQLETAMIRTAGPGIVFTEAGEKIRGVVSLRRQLRLQTEVRSITLDGFEVTAPIITIFTLGEPAEVLRLGYFGENPRDIQVILLDEAQEFVRGGRSELDEDDQLEVHRYYLHHTRFHEEDIGEYGTEVPSTPVYSPYLFDPERVFKAVYADAYKTNDDSVEKWLDLPTKVAVEIFHNLISKYRYADLYQPKDPQNFPFNEVFKPEFGRRVRNQGVLAFQLILRKDQQPFAAGQAWDTDQLEILPARYFNTSKVLRDRGIQVITATLPELRPVNPAVRHQLLNYWRAQWQRETDLNLAPYDYQEMKVRAAARVQAQKDIVKSLAEVVKDNSITPEIAVTRLFQALETFAKEPSTRKLLASDTLNMLNKLQTWSTTPPALSPQTSPEGQKAEGK